jgi:hypothetical protein
MEVLLVAMFSMWPAPRLYHVTDRIRFSQWVQCSWFEWSGASWLVGGWVSEWARELLQFSRCVPLLLDAGSWGTGTFREPRVRGKSAVGSRYQTTTGDDKADWQGDLLVLINLLTNPSPAYSDPYTWQYKGGAPFHQVILKLSVWRKLTQSVTLLTCIQAVFDWNIRRNPHSPEIIRAFSQSLQADLDILS